jgi:hypothetical protein
MSIQGLPEAYCTVAYADSVLGDTLPWDNAETADKEAALQWATVYIINTYSCSWDEDGDVPENVQTATAILGNYHLTSPLYDASAVQAQVDSNGLIKNKVVAGSVESEKEYDAYVSKEWIDPYPDATALLYVDGVCVLAKGGGLGSTSLVRT